MLERAKIIKTSRKNLVDTCGTGGDGKNTFNVSTAAAIIAAGAGVAVAKHGNRSMSGRCGSADVFEALGVNINLEAGDVAKCIEQTGIGFIFAQVAHPAMKNVSRARKEINIKTVFNILGPILNPALAQARVLGVHSRQLMPLMIQALKGTGVKRALVVCSKDGLDELSVFSENFVMELDEGRIREYILDPCKYGFVKKPDMEEIGGNEHRAQGDKRKSALEELQGGGPEENAEIIRNILTGKDMGPKKDMAVFNASAAVLVSGMAGNFHEAIEIAEDSVKSGKAYDKLNELIEFSAGRCF